MYSLWPKYHTPPKCALWWIKIDCIIHKGVMCGPCNPYGVALPVIMKSGLKHYHLMIIINHEIVIPPQRWEPSIEFEVLIAIKIQYHYM